MRVALLCSSSSVPTTDWVADQLARRGHQVDRPVAPLAAAADAADAGHALADRWTVDRPDVALAVGWLAGLAAQVAARETSVPVALRLTRAGRSPGSDRDRIEVALARGSALVLVPSAGAVDRLVDRGVPRRLLRVLPEAVDTTLFADDGAEASATAGHRVAVAPGSDVPSDPARLLAGLPACQPVVLPAAGHTRDLPAALRSLTAVVAVDDSDAGVSLVLQAMSCGVPTVAVDTGTLSDLVADQVTGLLVPRPADVPEALRSLLADPMRRQSMGLAAVDRARARFDTEVVGTALDRLLHEVVPAHPEVAAAS
ncbi:MAG TPA: glycosyltransferase [Actinomycetes bacterium]